MTRDANVVRLLSVFPHAPVLHDGQTLMFVSDAGVR